MLNKKEKGLLVEMYSWFGVEAPKDLEDDQFVKVYRQTLGALEIADQQQAISLAIVAFENFPGVGGIYRNFLDKIAPEKAAVEWDVVLKATQMGYLEGQKFTKENLSLQALKALGAIGGLKRVSLNNSDFIRSEFVKSYRSAWELVNLEPKQQQQKLPSLPSSKPKALPQAETKESNDNLLSDDLKRLKAQIIEEIEARGDIWVVNEKDIDRMTWEQQKFNMAWLNYEIAKKSGGRVEQMKLLNQL